MGFAAEKDNLVCLPLGVLIFRDREWHYSRHTDGENGLLLTKKCHIGKAQLRTDILENLSLSS